LKLGEKTKKKKKKVREQPTTTTTKKKNVDRNGARESGSSLLSTSFVVFLFFSAPFLLRCRFKTKKNKKETKDWGGKRGKVNEGSKRKKMILGEIAPEPLFSSILTMYWTHSFFSPFFFFDSTLL
jgi:hypothetical protein